MTTREERLELRLQGEAAYTARSASTRLADRFSRQASVAFQKPQPGGSNEPRSASLSATSSTLAYTHRPSENGGLGDLFLLQQKREKAREQERQERQREQERLDRDRDNEPNLIPDSKKAPQVGTCFNETTVI